jgi:hypothetical protein
MDHDKKTKLRHYLAAVMYAYEPGRMNPFVLINTQLQLGVRRPGFLL